MGDVIVSWSTSFYTAFANISTQHFTFRFYSPNNLICSSNDYPSDQEGRAKWLIMTNRNSIYKINNIQKLLETIWNNHVSIVETL